MNRKYARSICTFGLVLMAFGVQAATISVTNGDAETGDLTGWTVIGSEVDAVTSRVEQAGTVTPAEGSYFFSFAQLQGAAAWMTQTGTEGLGAGTTLLLTGFVQTEALGDPKDFGNATLTIYDSGDSALLSASSGSLLTDNLTWEAFSVSILVPENAAYWEVRLDGTREFGTYVNVFWDDLQMQAVPVPAAVWLFGSALGLLGWMRRKAI